MYWAVPAQYIHISQLMLFSGREVFETHCMDMWMVRESIQSSNSRCFSSESGLAFDETRVTSIVTKVLPTMHLSVAIEELFPLNICVNPIKDH